MTAFPDGLKHLLLGLRDQDQDVRTRTEMDVGPPITRRRQTAAVRRVSTVAVVTGTQRQTFDTFFRTTLKNGTLGFTDEDPVDDSTVTYYFVDVPQWELVRGGTSSTRVWRTTLNLEIHP